MYCTIEDWYCLVFSCILYSVVCDTKIVFCNCSEDCPACQGQAFVFCFAETCETHSYCFICLGMTMCCLGVCMYKYPDTIALLIPIKAPILLMGGKHPLVPGLSAWNDNVGSVQFLCCWEILSALLQRSLPCKVLLPCVFAESSPKLQRRIMPPLSPTAPELVL